MKQTLINASQVFDHEVQALSDLQRLRHKNIVQFYGSSPRHQEGDQIFASLVLGYVDHTLGPLLRTSQWSHSEIKGIARQLLGGISFIHR